MIENEEKDEDTKVKRREESRNNIQRPKSQKKTH